MMTNNSNTPLKVRFLGTGTSQGIPVIACDCEVCQSYDPRDKRLRVAIMVSSKDTNIVVDVGPDFRQQMLAAHTKHLDAILITHEHNDHVIGLDDVRTFNFRQGFDMPIYCMQRVLEDLRLRFAYTFATSLYPGAPRFDWQVIDKDSHFHINDIAVQCIGIEHGKLPILGFRFGDIAYCTDVKNIPTAERLKLQGLKVLILSALHHLPHHAHLNLQEALDLIATLKPAQAYLTHLSHEMGKTQDIVLPPNVSIAYDGLEIEV